MNKVIRKGISLLIAAGMLMGTVPVMAEAPVAEETAAEVAVAEVTEAAETEALNSMFTLSPFLPFFVVMMMTPLAAREP